MTARLGAACMIWCMVRPAGAVEPVDYVQPINWSKYNGMLGVQPGDTFGQSLIGVLQNESRHELAWVTTKYNVAANAANFVGTPYYNAYTNYPTLSYGASIRPLSSFAYGTAALLATDTYSASVAGRTRELALNQAELAIRGVAFAHRANKPTSPSFGGRGTSSSTWQAGYWSAHAAEAAWLIWDQLTPVTRTVVANMVVYEADAYTNYTVPYWKNSDGTTNFEGDTKAEENAWNSRMLALAQAMMPNHPNVTVWRTKASELQASSYSRQSDTTGLTLVDGKPVKDWLHGFNAFPDGVVVNHDIVHPDYMASYSQTWSVVAESLAGQYIPQSTLFNIDKSYQALTEINFTVGAAPYGTGSIDAPGGTVYKRTSGGGYDAILYYPQGNDWTLQVTDGYLNTDLIAEWRGWDNGKTFDAMGWAQARLTAIIAMQNRPGHNGNIHEPGDYFTSIHGADEDFYRSNAVAWLQWWLMQHGQMSPVADHWGDLPVPPSVGVDGDYNGNGVVDAADYLVWRKNFGLTGSPTVSQGNGDGDNDVDDDDYTFWRARFGNTSASGAGQSLSGSIVPEQTSLVLVGLMAALVALGRAGTQARS